MLRQSELKNIVDALSGAPETGDIQTRESRGVDTDPFISPESVRQTLSEKGCFDRNEVISFINLKGGTGKTTSAVTCARRACDFGLNPCLVDLDAQASATFMLARDQIDSARPFIEVWDKPEEVPNTLIEINEHLRLLPSSLDNSLLDLQLSRPTSQKTAIRECSSKLFETGHDLVIIDCPPSLGAGVISAICASDALVIPTTADNFALRGIDLTIEETMAIAETFGVSPPRIHILLTHFDRRIKMSEMVFNDLKNRYGNKVIAQPIRTSSSFAQAQEQGKTVFDISKAKKVQADYSFATRTLLNLIPERMQADSK